MAKTLTIILCFSVAVMLVCVAVNVVIATVDNVRDAIEGWREE